MQELKPTERLNLYYELGEEAIQAVVNDFYDRMINCPIVGHHFQGMDMHRLRRHQTKFMSYVLGSPEEYTGQTLRLAHRRLEITPREYEVTMKHLDDSLKKFNLDIESRAKIQAFIRSLKAFIIKKQY